MLRRSVPRACSLTRAALQVPAEYTPVDYTTKALQQTRVPLTWDADDPERKKQLRRKLTSEQLRDEDFAAYLGSGSEDEQDEGEKQVSSPGGRALPRAPTSDPHVTFSLVRRARRGFAARCLAAPPQRLVVAACVREKLVLRMTLHPSRAARGGQHAMTT